MKGAKKGAKTNAEKAPEELLIDLCRSTPSTLASLRQAGTLTSKQKTTTTEKKKKKEGGLGSSKGLIYPSFGSSSGSDSTGALRNDGDSSDSCDTYYHRTSFDLALRELVAVLDEADSYVV